MIVNQRRFQRLISLQVDEVLIGSDARRVEGSQLVRETLSRELEVNDLLFRERVALIKRRHDVVLVEHRRPFLVLERFTIVERNRLDTSVVQKRRRKRGVDLVISPSSDEDFKSSLAGGCSTGDDEQSDVKAASPYLVPHTFGDTGPLGNAWDDVSEHARTCSSCVYAGRGVHVFLLGRLLDDAFDSALEDALSLSIGSLAFESDSLSVRTSSTVSSHSVSVDPSSK